MKLQMKFIKMQQKRTHTYQVWGTRKTYSSSVQHKWKLINKIMYELHRNGIVRMKDYGIDKTVSHWKKQLQFLFGFI